MSSKTESPCAMQPNSQALGGTTPVPAAHEEVKSDAEISYSSPESLERPRRVIRVWSTTSVYYGESGQQSRHDRIKDHHGAKFAENKILQAIAGVLGAARDLTVPLWDPVVTKFTSSFMVNIRHSKYNLAESSRDVTYQLTQAALHLGSLFIALRDTGVAEVRVLDFVTSPVFFASALPADLAAALSDGCGPESPTVKLLRYTVTQNFLAAVSHAVISMGFHTVVLTVVPGNWAYHPMQAYARGIDKVSAYYQRSWALIPGKGVTTTRGEVMRACRKWGSVHLAVPDIDVHVLCDRATSGAGAAAAAEAAAAAAVSTQVPAPHATVWEAKAALWAFEAFGHDVLYCEETMVLALQRAVKRFESGQPNINSRTFLTLKKALDTLQDFADKQCMVFAAEHVSSAEEMEALARTRARFLDVSGNAFDIDSSIFSDSRTHQAAIKKLHPKGFSSLADSREASRLLDKADMADRAADRAQEACADAGSATVARVATPTFLPPEHLTAVPRPQPESVAPKAAPQPGGAPSATQWGRKRKRTRQRPRGSTAVGAGTAGAPLEMVPVPSVAVTGPGDAAADHAREPRKRRRANVNYNETIDNDDDKNDEGAFGGRSIGKRAAAKKKKTQKEPTDDGAEKTVVMRSDVRVTSTVAGAGNARPSRSVMALEVAGAPAVESKSAEEFRLIVATALEFLLAFLSGTPMPDAMKRNDERRKLWANINLFAADLPAIAYFVANHFKRVLQAAGGDAASTYADMASLGTIYEFSRGVEYCVKRDGSKASKSQNYKKGAKAARKTAVAADPEAAQAETRKANKVSAAKSRACPGKGKKKQKKCVIAEAQCGWAFHTRVSMRFGIKLPPTEEEFGVEHFFSCNTKSAKVFFHGTAMPAEWGSLAAIAWPKEGGAAPAVTLVAVQPRADRAD